MAALVWSQFSRVARHFAPSIDTPIKSFAACLWAADGQGCDGEARAEQDLSARGVEDARARAAGTGPWEATDGRRQV